MQSDSDHIISRREALLHNSADDCWIIIHNHVYDITAFLKEHPGGKDILLSRAGEDASSYFIGKHGRNKAVIRQLETMRIGTLPESEQIPEEAQDEPFFAELVRRCYAEQLYTVPASLQKKYFLIRALNVLAFLTLSIAALYAGLPWWIAVPMVMAQALIGTSSFGLIAHEATHRNYPENGLLKGLLSISWPVFWPFISQNALRYEHNSHHIKIGDPEYDYEVAAFTTFIRYSGNVRPSRMHAIQHKMAKYIYPFYANIITTIGGFKSGFWSKHNRHVMTEHTLSILVTLLYYIILPALLTGKNPLWFLLLYLVYQCTLYYGIYVGAAINHFVPQVISEIPEAHRNKFAYYVCHNTTNFCTGSKFWFWYTGGFNVQIEHHLIPFIPVENLPRMITIVKDLCAQYQYPYHNYEKVSELWNAHYDFLKMMSGENLAAALSEQKNKAMYQAR